MMKIVVAGISISILMAKCGMKYEGTKCQGDFNNQGICDCVEYAMLAEDFQI